MNIHRTLTGAALALLMWCPAYAGERQDVPEKYTWNVADLYPSNAAWETAREALAARLPELRPFRGRLGESAATLRKALETREALAKELERLYLYAHMLADVDTRASAAQGMLQQAQKLAEDFETEAAFLDPELLEIGAPKVQAFLRQDAELRSFQPVLDDVLRRKAHTLTPAEEKIVAQTSAMSGAAGSLYSIFTSAEMPFPEVVLSEGRKVRLDQAAYGLHRSSPNRDDRKLVFASFWKTWQSYKGTLGLALYNQVKAHVVNRDLRGYESCLEAALDEDNIPTGVYHQLIRDVNGNLGTLHRYLKLRQRMMGVDRLGYEDLYAPMVQAVDMTFTPEEAMELTLVASSPLGPNYVAILKKAYDDRWVDFMPSTGKRSGAYSAGGAYDVHPYQLLNFNGKYDDVSTLAHESGHSLHSYLSNQNQRFANADYSIFVAEVASTLNEDLLFYEMMNRAKDDDTRLFLLGERLEKFRTTLFRQTLFAEFELRIHELVESGQPLTGDSLNALYLDLVRRYYGHEAGVCDVDELYSVEWAFIPHFYRNFYVFQYATSLTASTSLASRIREEAPKGGTEARDAYLRLLSSGSSKYPVDLLRDAGVDMTGSAPFTAAIREMNATMDQMERILDGKGVGLRG